MTEQPTIAHLDGEPMHRILIRSLPLDLYAHTRQHTESLMREFAFIAEGTGDEANTPARLLQLVEVLSARYRGLNTAAEDVIEAALTRGDEEIDIELAVPMSVRQATIELGAMLDEADAFCRNGDLLTLATPPESVEFRVWYLEECVRQLDGELARSWPEWKKMRAS